MFGDTHTCFIQLDVTPPVLPRQPIALNTPNHMPWDPHLYDLVLCRHLLADVYCRKAAAVSESPPLWLPHVNHDSTSLAAAAWLIFALPPAKSNNDIPRIASPTIMSINIAVAFGQQVRQRHQHFIAKALQSSTSLPHVSMRRCAARPEIVPRVVQHIFHDDCYNVNALRHSPADVC